jgi:adenosylcobinamide kinase/adenosylcobinamide-phosphate guanylyltransferase
MSERLALVLGGTRSGKSRFGQARAAALAAGRPVTYLATALPGDPELDRRIDGHRRMRPADWPTVLVGRDLAGAIAALAPDAPLLLDGLTLWLSAVAGDALDDVEPILDGPVAAALEALDAHRGPAVVISDELGLGMVPLDSLSRAFRDLQGLAHQQFAAAADEVHLMVAGLPLTLRNR